MVLVWLYFIVLSLLIGGSLNSSCAQVFGWRKGSDEEETDGPGMVDRLRVGLRRRRKA